MTTELNNQVLGLSLVLQISKRVRNAATLEETAFIAVNESKQLISYRQSALWLEKKGVIAVSGLPSVETNTPYINWLTGAFRSWHDMSSPKPVSPSDDPASLPSDLTEAWGEWLPLHVLLCPLKDADGNPIGTLLFARETEWEDHELPLADELASIYSHGLRAFLPRITLRERASALVGTAPRKILLAVLACAFFLLPVRLSVLAPAEVAPKEPFLVRSPLDGVIDKFHVRPNEKVAEGQLLFELDKTNLRARLGVARKTFEVASEEYRQSSQLALSDDRGKLELMPRRGRMEEKAEELSYSQKMFKRVEVTAPRAGVAVFTDPNDWVGKAVFIGEKVLQLADPSKVEILIRVPVSDAIELGTGSEVILYLTTQPQHPYSGTLRYASYRAEPMPSGLVAYVLKADFAQGTELPRIGLSGTARIYGKRVSLGYSIFRRPLAALRQHLGW